VEEYILNIFIFIYFILIYSQRMSLGRVSCLGPLVAGHSSRRARFDTRIFYIRFVVNKVTVGHFCMRIFLVFNLGINPSVFLTHSVIFLRPYNSLTIYWVGKWISLQITFRYCTYAIKSEDLRYKSCRHITTKFTLRKLCI
jgi:hypothetical protein